MHELGIAQEIMKIVEGELARQPDARIRTVGLRIGEFSGVDTDSLSFCFECLKRETALEPAELRIERASADELDVTFIELEVA
jgi:hydrogenase nickel incorporation protein HypA/HybF